jgi:hypothetical protein
MVNIDGKAFEYLDSNNICVTNSGQDHVQLTA